MKKDIFVSKSAQEWGKHLRPYGKRRVNKSIRRNVKKTLKNEE